MKIFSYKRMRTQNGFTLIELLVVIAIIGILASVVLASLNSARVKARNASYLAQLKEYQKAFEIYYSNNGSYPPSAGSWACLGTGHSGGSCWKDAEYNQNTSASIEFRNAIAPYFDETVLVGPKNVRFRAIYARLNLGRNYQMYGIFETIDYVCPTGWIKNTSIIFSNDSTTACVYTHPL